MKQVLDAANIGILGVETEPRIPLTYTNYESEIRDNS